MKWADKFLYGWYKLGNGKYFLFLYAIFYKL